MKKAGATAVAPASSDVALGVGAQKAPITIAPAKTNTAKIASLLALWWNMLPIDLPPWS